MTVDQRNEVEISMNLLQQAAKREQRIKLITAVLLIFLGIILLIFSFEKNTALSILGLLGVLIGIQFAYQYFRYRDIDHMPIFQILSYKPESIVWVYSMVTELMPYGFAINKKALLYFKLINKDDFSIAVPVERLEVISSGLNHLLPHATFGYSKDREQWYIAAPEMLLREKEN